jgi:hypothetical protein
MDVTFLDFVESVSGEDADVSSLGGRLAEQLDPPSLLEPLISEQPG